jgi:Holliday junction resolvase
MNAKAKGARSERKVKKYLEEHGWYVTKAGASLGIWDLIAVRASGVVRLIQVKTNRRPSKRETETMQQFADHFIGVECWLVIVRDRRDAEWERFWPQQPPCRGGMPPKKLPYDPEMKTGHAALVPPAFGRVI